MEEQPKWSAQPGLTKPQLEQLAKAVTIIRRLGTTRIEIYGVIGVTERRAELSDLFGPMSQAAQDAIQRLGEKYHWTVGPDTITSFAADAQVAISTLRASLPVDDKRITQEEHDRREAEREAAHQAYTAKLQDNVAKAKALMPPGAKALIVAEYEEDDCDSGSDHYGTKTTRRVAIGWRKSTREDFRTLRAAAESYPETAHLGLEAAKTIEHREHYSGGRGNYLKAGVRYDTGWVVRSMPSFEENLTGEWEFHLPQVAATAPIILDGTNGSSVTVTLNQEKNGVELRFASKPAPEVLERLKSAGGWRWSRYSGCWYTRQTPESIAWAQEFAQSLS